MLTQGVLKCRSCGETMHYDPSILGYQCTRCTERLRIRIHACQTHALLKGPTGWTKVTAVFLDNLVKSSGVNITFQPCNLCQEERHAGQS